MTWDTFKKAIKFIKNTGSRAINISGGEPSLHPEVVSFAVFIKNNYPNDFLLSLISNGNFLEDEDKTKQILEVYDVVQVTCDDRYYPHPIDLDIVRNKYPNIGTEDRIRSTMKMGRSNKEEGVQRTSPFCFNMRSFIKLSNVTFYQACQTMEQHLKFCGWAIKPSGKISLSESLLCPTVGSVLMSNEDITESIRKFKCNGCLYAARLEEQRGPPYTLIFD
jgi:hypothetical protein